MTGIRRKIEYHVRAKVIVHDLHRMTDSDATISMKQVGDHLGIIAEGHIHIIPELISLERQVVAKAKTGKVFHPVLAKHRVVAVAHIHLSVKAVAGHHPGAHHYGAGEIVAVEQLHVIEITTLNG